MTVVARSRRRTRMISLPPRSTRTRPCRETDRGHHPECRQLSGNVKEERRTPGISAGVVVEKAVLDVHLRRKDERPRHSRHGPSVPALWVVPLHRLVVFELARLDERRPHHHPGSRHILVDVEVERRTIRISRRVGIIKAVLHVHFYFAHRKP